MQELEAAPPELRTMRGTRMIIDCEIYYHGPDDPVGGKVFDVEQLDALCREAGVDNAVLIPLPTFSPPYRHVAAAAASADRRRAPFVGRPLVNPPIRDSA